MHYFYLSNYLNYVILSWLVRHPQVVIWLSIVYSILAGGCPQSLFDIDCVCACVFAHLDVQLCLTHCNPMDGSPPPFLSIGILQARILEWLWCPPPGDLSNPGIKPKLINPHCRWIIYHLSHQGSPRILEWVACPFFSGSSWLRNQTRVSCIASRFFSSWTTREAPFILNVKAMQHTLPSDITVKASKSSSVPCCCCCCCYWVTKLCLTLCDLMDCNMSGSSVPIQP